jgi:hypothetical protein
VIDLTTAYDDQDIIHTDPVHIERCFINTTVGRAILNDHLPEGMPYINGLLKKKGIGALVNYGYLTFGLEVTVKMLDEVKTLGFQFATRSGLSIGIDDMVIPDSKKVWSATPRSRWSACSSSIWTAPSPTANATTRSSKSGRRSRKKWPTKCSVKCSARQRRRTQSDLRHGRLRRSRIETADPPALRHARIDGQAFRRNHRVADHGQLP